jgi:hypothetical protein
MPDPISQEGITVVKVDCLTRESYFTNQEIVAIEDNRRQYNTAQTAVWALLLTEHPLQTQGTAMF